MSNFEIDCDVEEIDTSRVGKVIRVSGSHVEYPIKVLFQDGETETYTWDGKIYSTRNDPSIRKIGEGVILTDLCLINGVLWATDSEGESARKVGKPIGFSRYGLTNSEGKVFKIHNAFTKYRELFDDEI